MFKRGYVRLMVASVAAIGLHALLILWPQNSALTVRADMNRGALQVALFPSQKNIKYLDLEQPSEAVSESETEKNRLEKHQPPQDIPLLKPKVLYDGVESAQVEEREDASPARQSRPSSEVPLVPAEVQATILANVSYPWQARRHGWEGEAEFRFNINNQSVEQVTMFASTGYPVLDRAARLGLVSMRSLPLSDGDYRLPVMFRLQ